MFYRVKVRLTGPELAFEYRFCSVVKGYKLGFSRRMVEWLELKGEYVGIHWTSRWVEKRR